MMIKKQQINTQLFSNDSKMNLYKTFNVFSENVNVFFFKALRSGKIKIRKSKIIRPMHNWFFTSTFTNGIFYRRRKKIRKLLNLNFFYFVFLKREFIFLKKTNFFSSNIFIKYNLFKHIPRYNFLFLLNNQPDFLMKKENSLYLHNDYLNHTVLLKKKTPQKCVLLNYFIFYKSFELLYKFVIINFNKNKFITFYKNPQFIYYYSLILLLNAAR